MRIRFLWAWLAFITVILLVPATHEVNAQRTRHRRSRRITNPVRSRANVPTPRPAPSSSVDPASENLSDPTLISTAEEGQASRAPRGTTNRTPRPAGTDEENLRQTVNQLSTQITGLSADLSSLKDQQRTLVNLERLSRAEQRAESFRTKLRDVMEKEVALQTRAEQIEYELKPENIDRRAATTGTLRPDELRSHIRTQLENEKKRIESQFSLITESRTRLESAIVVADTEVERLRALINQEELRDNQTTTNVDGTNNVTPPRSGTEAPTETETTEPPPDR